LAEKVTVGLVESNGPTGFMTNVTRGLTAKKLGSCVDYFIFFSYT